jgi:hypothetical protein
MSRTKVQLPAANIHLRATDSMRNYTMPEREALRRIRPRDRASKKQLLGIVAMVAIGVAGVGALIYTRYRIQRDRQQNWVSAIATVEDVRPKLVGQINSQYSGGMVYSVEILARYSADGTTQERWVPVAHSPRSLDAVNIDKRMWTGNRYLVRWQPLHPDRIEIEVPEMP